MKKFIKKFMPNVFLEWYHAAWPFLGALFYRYPSRNIKVIGITGTNGKTTTTHLCAYMLENAGHKTASISSLRFKIGKKEWVNKLKMTMPGRMKLQKFLRRAVRAGCEYAVIEVTSEGIKQSRHKFIKFDTAVFTNLTPEHIERHGSLEKYRDTKGSFFAMSHRASVINLDDENSEYFLDFEAEEKIGYGLKKSRATNHELRELIAKNRTISAKGVSFSTEGRKFNLPLLGEFNIYNALAAICAGVVQGLSLDNIKHVLAGFPGVPGRMEIIVGEPFKVFVDYAHTPDSLGKVYKTVRSQVLGASGGRMVCVLGAAGGGRDKWKRPEFGRLAGKYCDDIILTDEDPYTENPEAILNDIASGFSEMPNDKIQMTNKTPKPSIKYEKILDRRKAIHEALKIARENDTVVITGKGAEPLMMTQKGPVPWDDREVVRQEFNKLYF